MVGISKVEVKWEGECNLGVREPNEGILSGPFPLGNFRGRKFF